MENSRSKAGKQKWGTRRSHGERASAETSSTESLCQALKINDVSSQQTSLIHFCWLKSGYYKQTPNKNTFFVYKALLSKLLSLMMAFSRQLRPLDAEESFGNAPGWLQDFQRPNPWHPSFHRDCAHGSQGRELHREWVCTQRDNSRIRPQPSFWGALVENYTARLNLQQNKD